MGPQGAGRPVPLLKHKIQERYSPGLLRVTWFVNGRVEESKMGLRGVVAMAGRGAKTSKSPPYDLGGAGRVPFRIWSRLDSETGNNQGPPSLQECPFLSLSPTALQGSPGTSPDSCESPRILSQVSYLCGMDPPGSRDLSILAESSVDHTLCTVLNATLGGSAYSGWHQGDLSP